MTEGIAKSVEVFYSYALEDTLFQKELEKHLSILKRQKLITAWQYHEITAGSESAQEIHTHLNSAQIILLLVSSDFLASDYCYEIEMQRALERHKAGEACVIPIILRPVDWKDAPFGKLEPLPKGGKPITSWQGRHGRDQAFLDVTLGIRKVLEERNLRKSSTENRIEVYRETSNEHYTVEVDASIALVHTQRADQLYELKRFKEALASYNYAVNYDSRYTLAYRVRGETLYMLIRYEEALLAYKEVLRLDPNDASTYYNEGNVFLALKWYEEALAAYEKAIHLDPDNASLFYNQGIAFYMLKRYEEALAAYEKAIHLDPTHVKAYGYMGNVLYILKRYVEALAAFERALELDPNEISISRNKERLFRKHNQND